eukprot:11427-Heterococcus_DN1.PRE.1
MCSLLLAIAIARSSHTNLNVVTTITARFAAAAAAAAAAASLTALAALATAATSNIAIGDGKSQRFKGIAHYSSVQVRLDAPLLELLQPGAQLDPPHALRPERPATWHNKVYPN